MGDSRWMARFNQLLPQASRMVMSFCDIIFNSATSGDGFAGCLSNTFIISSESTEFDCCTVSTRVELAVGLKRITDGICGRTVSFGLAVPATAEELGCWLTVTFELGDASGVVVASVIDGVVVLLVTGVTGTLAVLLLLLLLLLLL
uniref:Uncharacterized protein n=1 Tax=Anopheles maculatus TaxID=74869 RepID=A0A182SB86_9DIPT